MVMRLGIVVNPDAGLGGKLGFKGSDGRAEEARAAGAEDRAGPRMKQCLSHLVALASSSLNRSGIELKLTVWDGRMGGTWLPELASEGPMHAVSIGSTPSPTTPEDTARLVAQLLDAGVEAILYAGGDGTTRDIVNALESAGEGAQKTALIGVPGGVKMHSGCFATTPKAAAEVAPLRLATYERHH